MYRELSARIGSNGLAAGLVPIEYETVPAEQLFDIFGGRSTADYVDSVTSANTLQAIADTPECGCER